MGFVLVINVQVYCLGLFLILCMIQFVMDELKYQLVYQLNEGIYLSSRERFGNYGIVNGFVQGDGLGEEVKEGLMLFLSDVV